MSKKIKIKTLDKTRKSIAGFDKGKDVYMKDVKNEINKTDINIIVFPDHIRNVAISFVQGFMSELLENDNLEEVLKYIEFNATEKALKDINEGLNA